MTDAATSKPTDDQLRSELDVLVSKQKRMNAGLSEIAERIKAIRAQLNLSDK